MTTNMDLIARVCERLKASAIGDLINEDDLREIVAGGIQKAFFEPRKLATTDRYGSSQVSEKPALITETLQTILAEKMQAEAEKQVAKWFADNQETTLEMYKKVFEQGIVATADKIMTTKVATAMQPFFKAASDQVNSERQQRGMPPLSFFF